MTSRIRRVAVITGTTGLIALAAGCGTNPQNANTPASAGSGRQSAPVGGPGGPGPANLSALATKLGVSQAKLQAAMAKVRPGPNLTRSQADAALAKELGLTAAQIRAAMQATRPAAPAGGQPPSGSAGQAPAGGQSPTAN